MSELLNEISKIGIVPVVVLEDADKAVGVAKALQKGGINCAEVTFRTAAAEESIKNIHKLKESKLKNEYFELLFQK